ncbi:hypothetical protein [Nocardia sp. NPDC059239]|uniref:hypothetical protein n=1 Tax=unclassified Nocardia TaxID=2637762 RepID=UPI00369E4342
MSITPDRVRELDRRAAIATGRLGRARRLTPDNTTLITACRHEAAAARISAYAGKLLKDLPPLPRTQIHEIVEVLRAA